jgi:hypothetical protein
MSLIDNFLGKQNLQGLTPEQQEQARSQGWNQLLMGSIFGGKGLASGYAAAQQVIPGMQAAEQQRRVNQAIQNSMVNLGVKPGSQLDLLQSQMGDLEDPTNRTAAALQRNVQQKNAAPGMGGTGLSASQQMLQRFDPTLFAQNIPQVLAGQDPKKAMEIAKMGATKFDENTGIGLDPFSGERTGKSLPRISNNIITQFGEGGTASATPVSGALNAKAAVTLPPLGTGQKYVFDANQNVVGIMNAAGAVQALGEIETVKALGAAAGQVERVFDPSSQTEIVVPRTAITGSAVGGGARTGGGSAGFGTSPGGFAAGPSADQTILSETTGKIFKATADKIFERAESAGNRIFNAQEVFNLADTLDPNKLTEWIGAASPYLRILPGVGDNLEKFSTNFTLLNQQYNRAVQTEMSGPAAVGNLNAQEVDLFKGSTFKVADPKASTKWISAVEIARADKDLARQEFLSDYISEGGKPAQFSNAWSQSPRNVRIYDHPKVNEFITGQVRDALAKPRRPKEIVEFNLPPGYKVNEVDLSTDEIIVTKPDGTKFRVR